MSGCFMCAAPGTDHRGELLVAVYPPDHNGDPVCEQCDRFYCGGTARAAAGELEREPSTHDRDLALLGRWVGL